MNKHLLTPDRESIADPNGHIIEIQFDEPVVYWGYFYRLTGSVMNQRNLRREPSPGS